MFALSVSLDFEAKGEGLSSYTEVRFGWGGLNRNYFSMKVCLMPNLFEKCQCCELKYGCYVNFTVG